MGDRLNKTKGNDMNIEDLGFTKEELQERIVNQACSQVLRGTVCDEDGYEHSVDSTIAKTLKSLVMQRIDEQIENIAVQHILPNVTDYVQNVTLTETNKWGEKTGETLTFIEYMSKRAEDYLNEKVSFDGKSQSESNYNWKGTQTRITHLINSHFQYSISTAMSNALKNANNSIVGGIEGAVKLKLKEISDSLKINVKMK
jgi:hypothetical protein